MIRYRVVFTSTAGAHVEVIAGWWAANRLTAPRLFRTELDAAVEMLEVSPELGTLYTKSPVRDVRRVLIGRSRYHIYWETEMPTRTVWVVAVWHTNRGVGPPL
jgi:plasmid stabilization system protein ParE